MRDHQLGQLGEHLVQAGGVRRQRTIQLMLPALPVPRRRIARLVALMRVVHRISLRPTREDRRFLAGHGFLVGEGLISFDIDEAHEHWPALQEFIARRQALDIAETRFNRPELEAAEWLEVRPQWHWSYPQPEDDFGYLRVTYDLSEYCAECGIGAIQKAPFRLKGEPRWARRQILQLNWVFDEYFVRPEVWEGALRPLGIDSGSIAGIGS